MLRMSIPRVASRLEAARYTFCGQSTCATCGRAIEWWAPPQSQRRAFDPMPDDRSPVTPHRCDRTTYPSPESLQRQTRRW
jgi:hypothetical protein